MAIGTGVCEQSVTEARACTGAVNVAHKIPNAKKAARANAMRFFGRRFIVTQLLLLSTAKSSLMYDRSGYVLKPKSKTKDSSAAFPQSAGHTIREKTAVTCFPGPGKPLCGIPPAGE